MLLIYPAIFHEEADSVWVEFPDLEGCQTFGDTVEECIGYAKEALEAYAESVIERDIKLPAATSIKELENTCEDGFVIPIYCEIKAKQGQTKSIKKTLTIPEWLNDKAVRNNINFSEILQNALMERLYR